jgi:hypothetical protein
MILTPEELVTLTGKERRSAAASGTVYWRSPEAEPPPISARRAWTRTRGKHE